MQGYIKLHRKICENEFYLSEKFTKMQAWIDLLLLATHTKRTLFIRDVEINLSPGQLCWSQQNLANRWKWNHKTVRRFLDMLEKREMVVCKTSNVTTIITVRNWNYYQKDGEQKGGQKGKQHGEQKGERIMSNKVTNKNVKNDKKEKNVKHSSDSKEYKLSLLLLRELKKNFKDFKEPNLMEWSKHIDLLHRSDGVPFRKIEEVIKWSQSDSFWKSKINSGAILRRNYNNLLIRKESNNESQKTFERNSKRKKFKVIK